MKKISKYKIIEEVGEGAWGVIYRALDPTINREVAVKTIRFELISEKSEKEEMMRRFTREVQAAGKLSHPNIVTIYDIGREKDLAYIVMQYIEGQSLQRLIASGKKFSRHEVIQIMIDLCNALDYAHQNGIVHRNIKPANILIDKEGKPFLVDFGVLRIDVSTLTEERATFGTSSYLSPEQVTGKKVDNRSDIFSLGAILYELLTGKSPFEAENVTTVIYKIVNEKPLALAKVKGGLPVGFQRVINKALAKNPEDRYQACHQLAVDLRNLDQLTEKTITFNMAKELESLEKKKSQKSKYIITISLAAIIIGILGGTWYFSKKAKKMPSLSSEIQETKAEDSSLPSGPNALVSQQIEDNLKKAKESLEREDFAETIKLAEQVLAEDANNVIAQEYLNKAKEKRNEAKIAPFLSTGISSYKKGDYGRCIVEMEKILELDDDHKEAHRYLYLADTAISRKTIKRIIERHRKAEEKKDLPSLLRDIDSLALSSQREEDASILFNYYDEIKSLVSNIVITFRGRNHADVSFSHLLTAVYRKTGRRKVLFEGVKTWKMRKRDRSWKIIDYKKKTL